MSISNLFSENNYNLYCNSLTCNKITTNELEVSGNAVETEITCNIYYSDFGTYTPLSFDYVLKVVKLYDNLYYIQMPERFLTIPLGESEIFIAQNNIDNNLTINWPFYRFLSDMNFPVMFNKEGVNTLDTQIILTAAHQSPLILNSVTGFGNGVSNSQIYGYGFTCLTTTEL